MGEIKVAVLPIPLSYPSPAAKVDFESVDSNELTAVEHEAVAVDSDHVANISAGPVDPESTMTADVPDDRVGIPLG